MHNLLLIMALMATGVTSATQSISLSNFTPRIENLPQSCQTAYTSPIDGCQAGDFDNSKGARCSAQCVQGLIKISQLVTQQCGNVDVPETSIIGVFLLGKGIPALCPGVEVTTIAGSSTQAPPAQTSQAPASSTQDTQSSSAAQSSNAASSASASPVTSAANTPNASATPPSSTAGGQLTLDTKSPPPKPSQTASSQKSNQDSGGGSPFDVVATGTSPQIQRGDMCMLAILGLAVVVVAFL